MVYPPEQTAEKTGAAKVAHRVGVEDMRSIDVVICGSVAVNRTGARIGKGAGYSDLEVALLIEAELVTEKTVIVTPVHQLQVVDEEIPETEHDFSVDFIVTPDEVIECPKPSPAEGTDLGGFDGRQGGGDSGVGGSADSLRLAIFLSETLGEHRLAEARR